MLGEWSGTGSEPWYDDNGGKHRRCNMAPPRAAAYSELTNGRDPVEAGSETKQVQHSPQYHMATGKRERRTLTPSRRNWTPRAGATSTPEKKAV